MPGTNAEPLISVIIAAYNQGPLLALAIESVLNQTYLNREIIVVNDGSTGTLTRETALRYEHQIVYIEQANGGVAAARNTGMAAAKGSLIALLDQDDLWMPNRLTKGVAAIQANSNVALIHSSYVLMDAEGRNTGVVRLGEGRWAPIPELLLEVRISSCTTLFRRQIALDKGGFDAALAGTDDWDMWLRMALLGYDFYCIGEPLACYRVHEEMTSRNDLLMINRSFAVLDKFYSQPSLPTLALEAKDQAYFNKHTWATAVFYGQRNLEDAAAQLDKAAQLFPEATIAGKLLRSLASARANAEGKAVGKQTIRDAAAFLRKEALANGLPSSALNSLKAQARLTEALHDAGKIERIGAVTATLLRYPGLIFSSEVRQAIGRLAGRISSNKKPGQSAGAV